MFNCNYKLTVFRNAMTENIMYPIRYFMDKSDKQTINIWYLIYNVKCQMFCDHFKYHFILFLKKGYNENGIKQCHVTNAFFLLFLSMYFFINIYFFIYMCIYTRMLTERHFEYTFGPSRDILPLFQQRSPKFLQVLRLRLETAQTSSQLVPQILDRIPNLLT